MNGGISNDFETENKPVTSTPAPMSTQSRRGKRQARREHFVAGTAHIGKRSRFSDSSASSLVKPSSSLDMCSLNEAQKTRTNACAICLSVLLSFFFQVYERNIWKSVMFRVYREQRDLLLDHTQWVEWNWVTKFSGIELHMSKNVFLQKNKFLFGVPNS